MTEASRGSGQVIPFPVPGGYEDEAEFFEEDYMTEQDPDEIVEASGRWVWQPAGEPPEDEPPVGMVSHKVKTMCRWQHRHLIDGLREPQPCCYSVLVTVARLPGPVRAEHHWLAQEPSVRPS